MSAERDDYLARCAATRVQLVQATEMLDEAMSHAVDGGDDDGTNRTSLLSDIDECLGEASRAIQAAQAAHESVDPTETEPDPDDDDGDGEDSEDAA